MEGIILFKRHVCYHQLRRLSIGLIICFLSSSYTAKPISPPPHYRVYRLKGTIHIDANWNKKAWASADSLYIENYMGHIPAYKPVAQAKMLYDAQNIYVIFKVRDRYVSSAVRNFNGPVSGDACVEFFFSPDSSLPLRYFNLEVNAGGTPLMGYHIDKRKIFKMLSEDDLKKVKIAHSLPQIIEKQIEEEISWTIEYKVPLQLLKKYGNVSSPRKGVMWRANFYKTASKSNNPHWITWSFVDHATPQFHLPEYFGEIEFM